jgi:hypothetical protein
MVGGEPMSTLKVNRIEPRTGDSVEIIGLDIPEPTESPLKAFAAVTKSPAYGVNYSSGFSSIVDNGVGSLLCNFSTPMPDANYAVAGCSNEPGGHIRAFHSTSANPNNFVVFVKGGGNDNQDTDYVGIMVAR